MIKLFNDLINFTNKKIKTKIIEKKKKYRTVGKVKKLLLLQVPSTGNH